MRRPSMCLSYKVCSIRPRRAFVVVLLQAAAAKISSLPRFPLNPDLVDRFTKRK